MLIVVLSQFSEPDFSQGLKPDCICVLRQCSVANFLNRLSKVSCDKPVMLLVTVLAFWRIEVLLSSMSSSTFMQSVPQQPELQSEQRGDPSLCIYALQIKPAFHLPQVHSECRKSRNKYWREIMTYFLVFWIVDSTCESKTLLWTF